MEKDTESLAVSDINALAFVFHTEGHGPGHRHGQSRLSLSSWSRIYMVYFLRSEMLFTACCIHFHKTSLPYSPLFNGLHSKKKCWANYFWSGAGGWRFFLWVHWMTHQLLWPGGAWQALWSLLDTKCRKVPCPLQWTLPSTTICPVSLSNQALFASVFSRLRRIVFRLIDWVIHSLTRCQTSQCDRLTDWPIDRLTLRWQIDAAVTAVACPMLFRYCTLCPLKIAKTGLMTLCKCL